MKTKKEKIFICQEMDEMLKQRVDYLVKISLINQRLDFRLYRKEFHEIHGRRPPFDF